MTEKDIQKKLLSFFVSHKYKFLNVYYFKNESDWLSFLNNGMCYEGEIKISRSDFFADIKKPRYRLYQDHGTNKYFVKRGRVVTIYNPSWELTESYPELVTSKEHITRNYRDDSITTSITFNMDVACEVDFIKPDMDSYPNKFFYIVPEGLVSVDEVPEYAGLIYISSNSVKKVKDGKFIHKNKLSMDKLFDKLYYFYATNKLKA